MYHLSDIKKYLRCKRLFYLENHDGLRSRSLNMLRCDEDHIDMIKQKLNIADLFVGKANDPVELVEQAIIDYQWLFYARYELGNLRLKLPLMHIKNHRKVDLYFLILLPNPIATSNLFYTQALRAIKKLGLNIGQIYLLHINPNYQRKKKLDVSQLLEISEFFFNGNHSKKEHVQTWIGKKIPDYSELLCELNDCLTQHIPCILPPQKCLKRPKCSFYNVCHGELIPEKNSETLADKQNYIRLMAESNEGMFIDYLALNFWIKKQFVYPLAFVDFEWDTFSVPPYKNMKSLDVIPFQFSLDILKEKSQIKHYDFLDTGDTRLKFLKSLLRRLPKTGSIIAFNVEGGEKQRLLELKRQFPKYSKKIDSVIKRFVDISLPFEFGTIYSDKIRGSFTLKNIVHSIGDLRYQDLEVSDGQQAIFKWRIYEKTQNKEIRNELLTYCRQDSFALIEIYRFLLQTLKDNV